MIKWPKISCRKIQQEPNFVFREKRCSSDKNFNGKNCFENGAKMIEKSTIKIWKSKSKKFPICIIKIPKL